jgi:hypothetical protein
MNNQYFGCLLNAVVIAEHRNMEIYNDHNLFGFCQSQLYFLNVFIITIKYPLHVSAPTGHLQVDYIYVYIYIYIYIYILVTSQGAIFLQRTHCSCFGYQLYIYFLVFCFGKFSPRSVCMWWI